MKKLFLTICLSFILVSQCWAGPEIFLAAKGSNPPTTPVISATAGDTQVTIALTSGDVGALTNTLYWDTTSRASYNLYANSISNATLVAASFPGTPYVHTGRTNGTPYYYRLCGTDLAGQTCSSEATATPAAAGCSTPAGGVMKEGFETPGKELTWTDISGTPTWNYASPGTPPAGVCSYAARFQGSAALTYSVWDNGSNITIGSNGLDYQISLYIASMTIEAWDSWSIAKLSSAGDAYEENIGALLQLTSDGSAVFDTFRMKSWDGESTVYSDVLYPSATTGWFVLKVHLDQAAAAAGSSLTCLSGCTSTTPVTFQRPNTIPRYFLLGPMTSADAVGEAFDMSFGYVIINQTP